MNLKVRTNGKLPQSIMPPTKMTAYDTPEVSILIENRNKEKMTIEDSVKRATVKSEALASYKERPESKMAKALTLIRKYHNMETKDLAEKLGLSANYLCEIERDKKTITYQMLGQYAEVFQISISSIVLFAEYPEKQVKDRATAQKFADWNHEITRINT